MSQSVAATAPVQLEPTALPDPAAQTSAPMAGPAVQEAMVSAGAFITRARSFSRGAFLRGILRLAAPAGQAVAEAMAVSRPATVATVATAATGLGAPFTTWE